tara:strand:+ start:704 stop:853 length:150 start_codon:yes stop_codon:yes gene_type:complete
MALVEIVKALAQNTNLTCSGRSPGFLNDPRKQYIFFHADELWMAIDNAS